jgi:hypothetical protein
MGDYPAPGGSVGPVTARLVTSGMLTAPSGAALAPSEPLPPGGPGPPVRGLAVLREPPGRGRLILRQLGWASMPIWSLGLLAFGPFLWLAITRRRRSDRAAVTAYIAASAAAVGLVSLTSAVSSSVGDAGARTAAQPLAARGLSVIQRPDRRCLAA